MNADINNEYEKYINCNLVEDNNHPIEKYDKDILILFDKYLHLTLDEYYKVKKFGYENGFIYNEKKYTFEIESKLHDKELDKKILELTKSIPHLCTVSSYNKKGKNYIIHLQRYSWCRVNDNVKLIKKWYKI